jgi:hypothetical protein
LTPSKECFFEKYWTPFSEGYRPVNKLATAGTVCDETLTMFSKRSPSSARASM